MSYLTLSKRERAALIAKQMKAKRRGAITHADARMMLRMVKGGLTKVHTGRLFGLHRVTVARYVGNSR